MLIQAYYTIFNIICQLLHMKQFEFNKIRLSNIFYYLFILSIPFNTRLIYAADKAYINGTFSSLLAYFLYLSDISFVICLASSLVEGKFHLKQQLAYLFLSFFGFIVVIFGVFHMKPSGFLPYYSILKLVELILIVFATTQRTNQHIYRKTAILIYISGLFQAILGIIQFHMQHSLGLRLLGEYIAPLGTPGMATIDVGTKIIRAYGTFPHPNVLAGFLLITLIFGYWLVSYETYKKGVFIGLTNILLLIAIFLTFSRTVWLAASLVTVSFIIYSIRNSRILRIYMFSSIVSCATILILWHKLLLSRVTGVVASNSYVDRGTYNNLAWEVIKSHPWLGTGWGNYIPTLIHMFHMQPWQYQPPHNLYIYIAASMGLPLAGLFIYFLIRVFISAVKAQNSSLRFTLLVLALSLFFISNFDHFLGTIQQGQLMYALSLGLIAGLRKSNAS